MRETEQAQPELMLGTNFDAAPKVQYGDGKDGGVASDSFRQKKPVAPAEVSSAPAAMTLEEKRTICSPYGFAKLFLNLPLYDGKQALPPVARRCALSEGKIAYEVQEDTDWQKRVLDALDPAGCRVSLRTANGSGKTSTILVAAILWHMAVFKNSLVISTAGVDRQVRAQLWPNLRKHAAKLEGWVFHDSSLTIEAPNGSRYMGFTTDKPERAEGWHGKNAEQDAIDGIKSLAESHTGPLFIIVDEAKGVPTGIFEAFDRCTFQRLLYCSSPGISDGEFFKSQTAAGYKFTRFVIPAKLCPHADHAKNAETIRKRGLDHPLVRSAIFAEFVSNEQGFVLTTTDIDRILTSAPIKAGSDRSAFCDFAAGGDENVFASRVGNTARVVKAWRDTNTMSACADFIRLFRAEGYTPDTAHEIGGDADGLGTPILDRLAELGWVLTRCRNGEAPDNPNDYFNWGTETWLDGAKKIRALEIRIDGLEHDEELKAQLLGRRQMVVEGGSKAGAMRVESKKDMQARGVGSPDRADALLACLRTAPRTAPVNYMTGETTSSRVYSDDNDEADRDDSFLAGAHC